MKKLKKHFEEYWQYYIFNIVTLALLSFLIWVFFISDILKNFLLWLEVFFQTQKEYAYLIAFLMAIAEGTIILGVMPGTSYVITAGVFWARGDMDPFILFPLVISGAFIGDILGYSLGRFSSKFIRRKMGDNANFKTAEDFIEKHGGQSVFFARFVNGIKELVPFIAGILKMNMRTFMFWNFMGAIGWSVFYLSIGFILGDNIKEIDLIVKSVGLSILTFFILTVFVMYRKSIKGKI